MQHKLKTLLRKSSLRKDGQPQHAKHDSGTATLDGRRSGTTSRMRDRMSTATSSGGSTHGNSSDLRSQPQSYQPLSVRHEPSVNATDHGMPDPEDIDSSVADNYRAYLPAISSEGDVPRDSRYMSLGGDSRFITGASELKHSEDIADRNIDMYGSSSRHGSLPSQTDVQMFQDPNNDPNQTVEKSLKQPAANFRRNSALSNSSVKSVGSPASVLSSGSKYALGTGVPTEGGLIDSIRPHRENTEEHSFDRRDWPSRVAREDLPQNWSRRKPRGNSDEDVHERQKSRASSDLGEERSRRNDGLMDLRTAIMDGPTEFKRHDSDASLGLDGVVDISNTEDVDKSTRIAPAVVHEVIKPHEHEIIEERIYREIHKHDVYHRIQPVYQTEILSPRHFIHDAMGNLVEISEDQIPDRTGEFQSWYIGKRASSAVPASPRSPRITEPRVVKDIKYMTPEGFERRETTIVHPPELEDMSGYGGAVVPIEFFHDNPPSPADKRKSKNKTYDHHGDVQPLSLKELSTSLPVIDGRS